MTLPLFQTGAHGIERAVERRSEGIARAAETAGEAWHREALAFLRKYARCHETIFCDDLWAAGLPPSTQPKALGALIVRAKKAGVLGEVVGYRKSAGSNMSAKPVHASLLWRAP